jgi:protein TonB
MENFHSDALLTVSSDRQKADKRLMSSAIAALEPMMTAGTSRPARRVGAASVSLALHAAAVLAVCMVVAPRALPPPQSPPPSFAVVMEPPAPPAEPQLQPRELQITNVPAPATLAPPAPLSVPAAQYADLHASRKPPQRILIKLPQEVQKAAATPAQPKIMAPAAPATPKIPPAPSQDALAGLKARIHQAVQEATIYPSIARMMHREGRTQVRFVYEDGVADEASIAASSNAAVLDEAALQAVRRAALPRPPAEFGARRLELVVWVDFHMTQEN